MVQEAYQYRGIYDENETTRINNLLSQQRDMFNDSDAKSYNSTEQLKKWGVIAIGATILLLTLRLVIKKKK
jgi:hypothetical protein